MEMLGGPEEFLNLWAVRIGNTSGLLLPSTNEQNKVLWKKIKRFFESEGPEFSSQVAGL